MRKQLIASILIAILLSSTILAQVSAGVKVGFIATSQRGDIDQPKMKAGLVAGPFVTLPVGESFAVQPELRFAMKGVIYYTEGHRAILRMTYLELPILAKFKIMQEKDIRPAIYIGPEFGLLRSAKERIGAAESNVKDDKNSIDIGTVIGVELNNDRKLFSDFRIGMGVINTNDISRDDRNMRNISFSFTLGVRY